VAIFKSFFGHYLGTLEGLNGLVLKFGYKGDIIGAPIASIRSRMFGLA
jgi:amino acid permease